MRTYKLLRVWIYLKTVNYIAGRCGHPTGHPGKEIVGKRFHKYIQKCKFMNLTAPKVDCVKHVYPKYNFYTVGNVVSFYFRGISFKNIVSCRTCTRTRTSAISTCISVRNSTSVCLYVRVYSQPNVQLHSSIHSSACT